MKKLNHQSPPVPASSLSEAAPASKAAHVGKSGFQRIQGMLDKLTQQFNRLKLRIESGKSQVRQIPAILSTQVSHRASATMHVRKQNPVTRGDTRSSSSPVRPANPLVRTPESEMKQNIARFSRVLPAILTAPASSFQSLSQEQKKELLIALNVCTGLSDTASLEGLLLLKDCISGLQHADAKAAAEANAKAATKENGKTSPEAIPKDRASTSADIMLAINDLGRICDLKLVALASQVSATAPAFPPPKQRLAAAADQLAKPLAAQAMPPEADTIGQELDRALAALSNEVSAPASARPGSPTAHPDAAIVTEDDLLAMLDPSKDLPTSVSNNPNADTQAPAAPDALDQLAAELAASVGPSGQMPIAIQSSDVAEPDDLDRLLADITRSLASAAPASNATAPTPDATGPKTGAPPPTPDRLA